MIYFQKLQTFILQYKIETVLLVAAFVIILFSLATPSKSLETSPEPLPRAERVIEKQSAISVEINGEVKRPDVYEMPLNSRLVDLLDRAGGLTEMADHKFFGRNFNLAIRLLDQEKFYVPSSDEVAAELYIEPQKIVEVTVEGSVDVEPQSISYTSLININNASATELIKLPGVSKTVANLIIKNRPYADFEEFIKKNDSKKSILSSLRSYISY